MVSFPSIIEATLNKTQPVFTINPVTSPTNQDSQALSGTREAMAAITAACNTATVGTVSYPTETTWNIALTNLTEGANAITLTARDAAGNTTVTATIISLDRTVLKGDINGNGSIDLTDAVMAMQILSHVTPAQPINKKADIDGDGKIGLPEVIFILQRAVDLR